MGLSEEDGRICEAGCDGPHYTVEFLDAANCRLVSHLIKDHGMTFAQAVDYAELRENYHWMVVEA